MKRIQIIKRVNEGDMLPPFYGVAWADMYRRSAVCLPVPINLLAALLRGAWLFARHGWRPVPFNPRQAYDQGRRDERKGAKP